MRSCPTTHLLAVFLLSFASPAFAQSTWIVDPGGGGHFTTLQGCLDAPSVLDGDTCLASAGTYVENVRFNGKEVTLKSADGPETTVIDGGQAGTTVTFDSDEGSDAVLDGFTVRGGSGTWVDDYLRLGGGILVSQASPTLRDCVVTGNTVSVDDFFALGGGIACRYASPTITRCTITDNETVGVGAQGTEGGGLFIRGGNPVVTDCVITENRCRYGEETLGGGIACLDASPPIVNCIIARNLTYGEGVYAGGGGAFLSNASPSFLNCTVTENDVSGTAPYRIGGGLILADDAHPIVKNSILWADTAPDAPEMFLLDVSSPVVTFSDVQMEDPLDVWPGEGNIQQAPGFTPAPNYPLSEGSPCVDGGDADGTGLPETDVNGQPRTVDGDCDNEVVVDMGASELQKACPWPSASTLAAGGRPARDLRTAARVNALAILALPIGLILLRVGFGRRKHGPP